MTLARESAVRRHLVGFDQVIDSDIDIPGAVPAGSDSGPATIRVALRETSPIADSAPLWTVDAGDLVFTARDTARYRCSRDRIDILPAAERDAVIALLIATALPAALWMRGALMLHAAAIVPAGGDRAIAISGPSGAGKSTLAADLLTPGARLVADDSVAVTFTAGGPWAAGLGGGLHLTPPGARDRAFHPVAAATSCRSARLGAVLLLCPEGSVGAPARLGGLTAVEHLLAQCHRPSVPALLGRRREMLEGCATLARTVPIYRWHARYPLSRLPDLG